MSANVKRRVAAMNLNNKPAGFFDEAEYVRWAKEVKKNRKKRRRERVVKMEQALYILVDYAQEIGDEMAAGGDSPKGFSAVCRAVRAFADGENKT